MKLTEQSKIIVKLSSYNHDEWMILIDSDIKKLTEEYNELTELLSCNANARIQAISDIHAGTKIMIAGDFIHIHDDLAHVRFKKERGEIKPTSF